MIFNTFFTCPLDCATQTFPALPADPDCLPTPEEGQIHGVVIRPRDTTNVAAVAFAPSPFGTWGTTTTTVTAANIDNTNTDGTLNKHFKVMGSVDEPTEQIAEVPGFGERVVSREYTLVAVVNGLSDEMYNYLVSLQCGRADLIKLYYYDTSYLYGDTAGDGIDLKSVNVKFSHPSGRGNYTQASIEFKFEAKTDPVRVNNPF